MWARKAIVENLVKQTSEETRTEFSVQIYRKSILCEDVLVEFLTMVVFFLEVTMAVLNDTWTRQYLGRVLVDVTSTEVIASTCAGITVSEYY